MASHLLGQLRILHYNSKQPLSKEQGRLQLQELKAHIRYAARFKPGWFSSGGDELVNGCCGVHPVRMCISPCAIDNGAVSLEQLGEALANFELGTAYDVRRFSRYPPLYHTHFVYCSTIQTS